MRSQHFLLVALVLGLVFKFSTGNLDFDLSDRIVGGEDAVAGEFPFFVQWRGCGASLIWEDILLTAAHVRQLACFVIAIFNFSDF
jgi:secreted trypsin-like serine protease